MESEARERDRERDREREPGDKVMLHDLQCVKIMLRFAKVKRVDNFCKEHLHFHKQIKTSCGVKHLLYTYSINVN